MDRFRFVQPRPFYEASFWSQTQLHGACFQIGRLLVCCLLHAARIESAKLRQVKYPFLCPLAPVFPQARLKTGSCFAENKEKCTRVKRRFVVFAGSLSRKNPRGDPASLGKENCAAVFLGREKDSLEKREAPETGGLFR
jgi:hypothetical protein